MLDGVVVAAFVKRSITLLVVCLALTGCATTNEPKETGLVLSDENVRRLESIFSEQEILIRQQYNQIQRLRQKLTLEKSKLCT